MECRDVRDLIDSFLSGELLTEMNQEILHHLKTCPLCRADLDARRARRDDVRAAFHRAADLEPSPAFIVGLRTTLQNIAYQAPPRRRTRLLGWWALAATVLLAATVGLAYRGREWMAATGALAHAAVGDHLNCALHFQLAEKPISLDDAASRYGPEYLVLENLPPDDVMTAAGPARVLERHACVYGGRRFAHIVFEYRGQRVSLLVTAAGRSPQLRLPGDAVPHVTSAGRIDAMAVVSFRAAGQMVFFAGDVAQTDLMTLADALAEPLYRGLAGV